MDAKTARRENLQRLIDEHGGQAELGRVLKKDAAYLSQLATNWRNRGMGARFARYVEKTLHKPHGWMDQDHSKPAPRVGSGGVVREATAVYLFGDEAKELASEWEKLAEPERSVMHKLILLAVAAQKREQRSKGKTSNPGAPAHGDRPVA